MMQMDRLFNSMQLGEYYSFIEQREQYTDFNTLGLFRSILENEHLTLTEKLELRDFCIEEFPRFHEFLQLKDAITYIDLSTLGLDLTVADEAQLWQNLRRNQQRILMQKRIKHRNFGNYSKHNCAYPDCVYNGLMLHPGTPLAHHSMHFKSDKNKYSAAEKAERNKREQRRYKNTKNKMYDDE